MHPRRDCISDWQIAIQDRLCCLKVAVHAMRRNRPLSADRVSIVDDAIKAFERKSLLDLAEAGLAQHSLDLVSGILNSVVASHPVARQDPKFHFLRAKLVIDSYHSGSDPRRNVNKALRSFASSSLSSSSSSLLRLRADLFEVASLQIRHHHVTRADKAFAAIFDTLGAFGISADPSVDDPSAPLLDLAVDSHREAVKAADAGGDEFLAFGKFLIPFVDDVEEQSHKSTQSSSSSSSQSLPHSSQSQVPTSHSFDPHSSSQFPFSKHSSVDFAPEVISCFIEAMKRQTGTAYIYFPKLLNLVAKHEQLIDDFR